MKDLNSLPLPELFEALVADGSLARLLAAARAEDLGQRGDVTTAAFTPPSARAAAAGTAREAGVVAGLAAIPALLESFRCAAHLEAPAADGSACRAGEVLFRLEGPAAGILAAERTLLNLVGRLCGVATLTRRYVAAVSGTRAVVCDTRKTTPGLRALEKYAVRCGGGTLHRIGLFDAVLVKDNHLAGVAPGALAATVAAAAARAREQARGDLRFVEVEVDRIEQLEALLALDPGTIDIVLLDNMGPADLRRAVALRDRRAPRLLLEASGGITLENVRAVAETGVDRIAVGALTRAAPWLDVGLDMERSRASAISRKV